MNTEVKDMEFVRDKDANSLALPKRAPSHRGPHAVATVFLAVAFMVLALGLLSAVGVGIHVYRYTTASVERSIGYAIAVALSAAFVASVLAFFGYVLDLLTEVAENTRP